MLARPSVREQSTGPDADEVEIAKPQNGIAARAVAAMAVLATLSLAAVPLFVTPGYKDVFVLGKDLLIRVEALMGAVLLTAAIAFGGTERLREMLRDRAVAALFAGTVVWTLITALTSTSRATSVHGVISVCCAAVVFFMTWYAAPRIPLAALHILIAVSVITAGLIILQAYGIWQPFTLVDKGVLDDTATIGNPNVVGSYLAIVAVVLGMIALANRGAARWLPAAGMLVAVAGLVVSQTRTAMIAFAATTFIALLRYSRKYAIVAVVLIAMIFGAGLAMRFRPFVRAWSTVRFVLDGQWNDATSYRVPAFLAAVEMFRARPLLGLGPSTFDYHYMEYKAALHGRYRSDLLAGGTTHFGDAHNDHLQLLAESGIPAYLLFLAAMIVLARGRPGATTDESAAGNRARTAALIGLPLAVVTLVIALAQFPLQIGVTRHLIVTMAALVVGVAAAVKNAARIAAVAIVAAICMALAPSLVYRPYRCNAAGTELLRATSGATQMTDDYQRTLSARRNLQALRPLLEHCPRQINVYTMLGANEQMLGRPAEAVEAYRQALTISPRPEVYMEIGTLLVELGRVDEGVDALIAAARYDQIYLNSIEDRELLRLVETKMLEQDRAQTR